MNKKKPSKVFGQAAFNKVHWLIGGLEMMTVEEEDVEVGLDASDDVEVRRMIVGRWLLLPVPFVDRERFCYICACHRV